MVELSKLSASWRILFVLMTGNVVISEVDAVLYVALSKAKKHMPYGEILGSRERITL